MFWGDFNQYFYLIGVIILGLIWSLIYVLRQDLRKEMLSMSLFLMPFGLTEHFWYYDVYWRPIWLVKFPYLNVGLEDFLLCFFYGGIAAALYEFTFKKHLKKFRKYDLFQRKVVTLIAIMAGISTAIFCDLYLKTGILFATGWAMIMTALVIFYFRKDLVKPALINFFLMLVVVLFWQGITKMLFPNMYTDFWLLANTTNQFYFGVLLEEYFWHASLAIGIGPFFEMVYGYRDS